MMDELKKYIEDARTLQMSDATISNNLIKAGWTSKAVAEVQPATILQTPLPSIIIRRKYFMYLVSALLPPFGLLWATKYLRRKVKTGRRIGIIIIVLTIFSLSINIWLLLSMYNRYFEQMSSLINF